MTRILIAEDETRIASFLQKGLRAGGYTTVAVTTGRDTVALARDDSFDLLLLDLGLPDMDGHGVLKSMRARGERMPVVILTAHHGIDDIVAGLEDGADDYVTKPFRFDELVARIRLRLRNGISPESVILSAGELSLDLRSRRASIGDRVVELTAREFALTEVFVRHAHEVLSREQLLAHVWGYDFEHGSNVVDVYVRYLRRKLGDHTIETVRGMGYRLRTFTLTSPCPDRWSRAEGALGRRKQR